MFTVEDFTNIRDLKQQGWSVSAIVQRLVRVLWLVMAEHTCQKVRYFPGISIGANQSRWAGEFAGKCEI